MSEHPIIMSAESVRAILAGRKSQTRRVMKCQPLDILPCSNGREWVTLDTREPEPHGKLIRCRYGQAGDLLWVRETWGIVDMWMHSGAALADFNSDDDVAAYIGPIPGFYDVDELKEHVVYRADHDRQFCWRPSIHMPRWASRLTLGLTSVRAVRVQDITAQDVEAEGVDVVGHLPLLPRPGATLDALTQLMAQRLYYELWDSINAKRGYSWDSNPWCWVLAFEVSGER